MTLLREVTERPLDAGYAEAAQRKRDAQGATGTVVVKRRLGSALVAVLALAAGLGVTTAIHHLRTPAPGAAEARGALERQIATRNEQLAELTQRAGELIGEIELLQHEGLADAHPELLAATRRDTLHNGTGAVTGPGLVITLTDGGGGLADGGGLVDDPDPDVLVHDVDLQTVVNSLWAAGAEAISVDDQRLTSRTSIRNAGSAIFVNLVPLSGPTYTVRAIGDVGAMQDAIAASELPLFLRQIGSSFGIRSSIATSANLSLPGFGAQPLRHASPLDPYADDRVQP